MFRFGRILAGALLLVAALCGFVRYALATQNDAHRLIAGPRAVFVPAATPSVPSLPFGSGIGLQTELRASGPLTPNVLHPDAHQRRPAIPTVSAALRAIQGRRSVRNAAGGTVVLIGTQNVPFLGSFSYVWDGTLQYGQTEKLECQGLTASTSYKYVVFAPKAASSAYSSAATTTDASGNCPTGSEPSVTFSTPFGSGSDPSYPGVWAIAMQNQATGNYDEITFVVVLAAQPIVTSQDASANFPATDFKNGSVVYVSASGLSTTDSYAVGFQYTAASPVQCVFTVPASAVPRNGPCFNNGTTVTGQTVTGGALSDGWNTSVGGTKTGTYSVVLQDTTTNETIGTRQISLQPSAGAATWTLVPYNGGAAGPNVADTFAFAGYTDQSVSSVDFSVAGLTVGDNVSLTISNPNGVVQIAPVAKTAAATTDFGRITFPVKTSTMIAGYGPFFPSTDIFGPSATTYNSNVFTAQVFDKTTGTVVASKSFHVVSYAASLAWTSPSTAVLPASTTGTNATITIANPSATRFGAENADTIHGIKLVSDGNETIAIQGGATFENDSAGNRWDITTAGGTLTIVPDTSNPNAVIDAVTTLQIPAVVTVPSGNCVNAVCTVHTEVLPTHGIAYSANDGASNPLRVASTSASNKTSGTFGYLVTNGPAPIGTPRFTQAMYVQGTGGTASNALYTLQLSLTNTSTVNCDTVASMELTLPPTFSANNVTLTGVSIGGNSCTGTCGWLLGAASLVDPNATGNQVYLWDFSQSNLCSGSGSYGNYVPANGGTATFTFTFPMWTTSYAFTDTTVHANPDGGCPPTASTGNCTGANAVPDFLLKPTAASRTPIVPSSTSVDSTALAVYSLNPALMKSSFSPATIGSSVPTTTTWNFTNTSTSADANPDYVDQFTLTIPYGMVPDSITAPAPWVVTKVSAGAAPSTPGSYTIALCASPPCSQVTEQNAVAPGSTLPLTFKYTTTVPQTGNYTMSWTVVGANGGATSNAGTTPLSVNVTTAQIQFSGSGGIANYPGQSPTAVTAGAEPTAGSDSDKTFGNTYAYTITNNGTTPITAATITIPNQDRNFNYAPAPYFTITKAPYVSGGGVGAAGAGCNGTVTGANYASSTSSATGQIVLTNCNITAGKSITVYWDMQVPYSINSEYVFPTLLNPGAMQANGTPAYTAANDLKIVLDAKLTIFTPPSGTGTSLAAGPGASSPTTNCVNCVVDTTQTPTVINFGSFAGTFTTTDLVNASVLSDANNPNGWQLYVSANQNQATYGLLQSDVSTNSNPATAAFTLNQTTYATVPTSAPGLLLSSYNGASTRPPVDTVMNYQVSIGSSITSASTSVLLTYTLIVQ